MAAKKKPRRATNLWLHGAQWWCRVRLDEREKRVGTGTEHEGLAQRRRDLFTQLAEDRKHLDLLGGVLAGRVTLAQLYDAFHAETLDSLRVQATSTNLEPLVATWLRALEADRAVAATTRQEYEAKLRTLMPEGRAYYAAQLTHEAVREWLRGLTNKRTGAPLSTTSRRHYFDALRAFVRYCIEEKSVWKPGQSPLIGFPVPKLAPPRERHFSFTELTAALDAVTHEEARIALTLIAGSGMELSAAERCIARELRPADRAVWAHGTKNGYRDRVVFIREWAWKRVAPSLRAKLGSAPLYTLNEPALRAAWYDAQKAALGLEGDERHTIHDLRHTYCFLVLTGEDGEPARDLQWCADQLGHANTIMVSRIYGKYRLKDRARLEAELRRSAVVEEPGEEGFTIDADTGEVRYG